MSYTTEYMGVSFLLVSLWVAYLRLPERIKYLPVLLGIYFNSGVIIFSIYAPEFLPQPEVHILNSHEHSFSYILYLMWISCFVHNKSPVNICCLIESGPEPRAHSFCFGEFIDLFLRYLWGSYCVLQNQQE